MFHAIAIKSTNHPFLASNTNRVFFHPYHCFQMLNIPSTILDLFTTPSGG